MVCFSFSICGTRLGFKISKIAKRSWNFLGRRVYGCIRPCVDVPGYTRLAKSECSRPGLRSFFSCLASDLVDGLWLGCFCDKRITTDENCAVAEQGRSMKNRNIIHWAWLGLLICLLDAAPAHAFYNPQQGAGGVGGLLGVSYYGYDGKGSVRSIYTSPAVR
jgi:hypothetical protein